MIRVAIVGAGRWGANLLRVLAAHERAEIVAVADLDPDALQRARALAPRAELVSKLEDALSFGIDAVVVATPTDTHARLVLTALEAGVDVLVEKPLAINREDAKRCAQTAKALGRIAMVGHVLLFHPAIERMIAIARSGELGKLVHFGAWRLSFRGDPGSSTLWTLGPHDLAVLHALDARALTSVHASGSGPEGRIVIDAEMVGGLEAEIVLSRSNATKERRMIVSGSRRALLFDDVRAPTELVIAEPRARTNPSPSAIQTITVAWEEPLAREVEHFLGCVETRAKPRASFDDGAWVVDAIARASAATSIELVES